MFFCVFGLIFVHGEQVKGEVQSRVAYTSGYFYVSIRNGSETTKMKIEIQISSDNADEGRPYCLRIAKESEAAAKKYDFTIQGKKLTASEAKAIVKAPAAYETYKGWVRTYKKYQATSGSLATTMQCHTLDPSQAAQTNPESMESSEGTNYKANARLIFEAEFSYTLPAYMYPGPQSTDVTGRVNSRLYSWANLNDAAHASTIKKGVYHQATTTDFRIQCNLDNTGIPPKVGDVISPSTHVDYICVLRHPSLNISYHTNGGTATAGNTGKITGKVHTVSYSYTDAKNVNPTNFSTLSLTLTGYKKNDNAEWNKKTDGTGTAFGQDVDDYATSFLDFTDGEAGDTAFPKNVTLYAQWVPKTYTVTLKPNGGTVATGKFEVRYDAGDNAVLSSDKIPADSAEREFLGWYTESSGGTMVYDAGGRTVNDGTWWKDNLWQATSNLKLYAHWSGYRVTLSGGEGITSLSGAGRYYPGEPVTVTAGVDVIYDFEYWAGTLTGTGNPFTFSMPSCNVTLTATATKGEYRIEFNPNGGSGVIDPIYPAYLKEDVVLPDVSVTHAFTHQNENGASKFLGWNEDAGASLPAYSGGEVVPALTEEHYGTVTLYAVWDTCPGITAYDLYYSLEQAKTGAITEWELLSRAAATDREDGVIPAGDDPGTGTSFRITDYKESDFTQFIADGSATETYRVRDSVGNEYTKQITVHIVDTTPSLLKPESTTRFISEKYYLAGEGEGGLSDTSIWKTNPEYVSVLQGAFSNLKADTPQYTYRFTHENILEMKEYIAVNGFGNTNRSDALLGFYQTFLR